MKKVLLLLLVAFAGLFSINKAVEVNAATGEKVVIHYYKLAGDYDGVGVWTWGNGDGGSANGIPATGFDADGWATVTLNVDKASMSDTGEFIPFGRGFDGEPLGAWPSWGDAAKDSKNGMNISYNRAAFKASSNNTLDVYFVQGQEASYLTREEALIAAGLAVEDTANPSQIDEDYFVLTYIYFDPTGSYEDWNIWNWGEGGASLTPNERLLFTGEVNILYNGITAKHKVAYVKIQVAEGSTAPKVGFILRTDAWAKKYPENIFFDLTTEFLAPGYGRVFYLAGEGQLRSGDVKVFLAEAYAFKVSVAEASSPTQIQLEVNKDIKTVLVDEEGVKTVNFQNSWITLKDKDGVVVPVLDVLYDSTVNATKKFSLVLSEVNKLVPAKAPYTVTFAYEGQTGEKEVSYDTVAPTFTLIDSANQRVEIGSTWALGIYSADDDVDGVLTPFVTASGVVDTTKVGTYTVTLTVSDSLGNVGTQTITVEVYDPCAEEEASAFMWVAILLTPLVLAGFAVKKFVL